MSSTRKLQQEVDKVMKLIQEGLEKFHQIWERYDDTEGPNRDKLESELKREIKKQQRHRDTIKGYVGNKDIKNQRPLLDARKSIETEMERFKGLEKDSKMKTYSKAGLQAALERSGDDRSAQDNEDYRVVEWVEDMISKLEELRDELEDELSTLDVVSHKRNTHSSDRRQQITDVQTQLDFHQGHLNTGLERMSNEELVREQLVDVQEGVIYFLESHNDAEYFHDENLYDVQYEDQDTIDNRVRQRVHELSSNDVLQPDVTSNTSSNTLLSPTSVTPIPMNNTNNSISSSNSSSLTNSHTNTSSHTNTNSMNTPNSVPTTSSTSSNLLEGNLTIANSTPPSKPVNVWTSSIPAAQALAPTNTNTNTSNANTNVTQQMNTAMNNVHISVERPNTKAVLNASNTSTITMAPNSSIVNTLLSDQGSMQNTDFVTVIPKLGPSTWNNAYRQVPSTPLLQQMHTNAHMNASLHSNIPKFNSDVLKFICNAQQGTPLHYNAARELKRQQHRFHNSTGFWVKRLETPQIKETFERGLMHVHDIHNWTQQKVEFTFNYAQLEVDVPPSLPRPVPL